MRARFRKVGTAVIFASVCTLAMIPMSYSQDPEGGASPSLELSNLIVSDGSVLMVRAKVPVNAKSPVREEDLSGTFDDISFSFYQASPDVFEAVLGIPYGRKPGHADVQVTVRGAAGREEMKLKAELMVIDGNYAAEQLRVSPKHLNPSPKDLIRIRKEKKEIGAIYRTLIRKKYWDGPLKLPINSAITSVYGTKRVFNGELASYHSGTDLRAAVGTPIFAPAPGVVVLSKHLFFSGGTVMIDHGYGVITFYAHMSKFRVKKGEVVKTGQLLGLSGATGRVSGPHLHWSAVVHGAKVNPQELMKLLK